MHAFYDFTVCYNFSYVIDQASSLVNFFFEVHVYRMLVPEKIGNCDHIWHAVSLLPEKKSNVSVWVLMLCILFHFSCANQLAHQFWDDELSFFLLPLAE